MSDDRLEKLQTSILTTAKEMLKLDGAISSLQASINVLKICVASQMRPDNPGEALTLFSMLEKNLMSNSPANEERKKASDLIDALQQWMRTGVPPAES